MKRPLSGDPTTLIARADTFGVSLFSGYGSSEVQAMMARQPSDADPARRATGGGLIISELIKVRIRDLQTGEIAAFGEPGEIEISGPNTMIGYLSTSEPRYSGKAPDGYVSTGDLGYLTGDGFVYIARIGDVLRLSGFLVNPMEIEAYLTSLPGITAAQAVGVSRNSRTRLVHAGRDSPVV